MHLGCGFPLPLLCIAFCVSSRAQVLCRLSLERIATGILPIFSQTFWSFGHFSTVSSVLLLTMACTCDSSLGTCPEAAGATLLSRAKFWKCLVLFILLGWPLADAHWWEMWFPWLRSKLTLVWLHSRVPCSVGLNGSLSGFFFLPPDPPLLYWFLLGAIP